MLTNPYSVTRALQPQRDCQLLTTSASFKHAPYWSWKETREYIENILRRDYIPSEVQSLPTSSKSLKRCGLALAPGKQSLDTEYSHVTKRDPPPKS